MAVAIGTDSWHAWDLDMNACMLRSTATRACKMSAHMAARAAQQLGGSAGVQHVLRRPRSCPPPSLRTSKRFRMRGHMSANSFRSRIPNVNDSRVHKSTRVPYVRVTGGRVEYQADTPVPMSLTPATRPRAMLGTVN